MKRLFISLFVFFVLCLPNYATAQNNNLNYKANELIVKFKDGVDEHAKKIIHQKYKAVGVRKLGKIGLQEVTLPDGSSVTDAVNSYSSEPDVEYAEPNYKVRIKDLPLSLTADPLFSQQWNLLKIFAPEAWNITSGNKNVVIAFLDTGIDYNHPDLQGNLWTDQAIDNGIGYDIYGINVINGTSNVMDDNGHGTFVAGVAGAVGDNGEGIIGVNPNVSIFSCKFLDSNGAGYVSGAVECLNYIKKLKDSGVNIVATNNSWGCQDCYSQALYDAINDQRKSGILFITAAGNLGADNDAVPLYPAGYMLPNIIAVASTDQDDNKSFFSDYGRRSVHVAAPGDNIISLRARGTDMYDDPQYFVPSYNQSAEYCRASGTSIAAAHVTGLAVLLEAQDESRDWRAVKNLILAGGENISSMNGVTITGKRINAYGSLTCTNSPVFSVLQFPGSGNYKIGQPVLLSALSINCQNPIGPVTVNTSDGTQIELHDDGVGPDIANADGVFTGVWTPSKDPDTLTFSSPAGQETITVTAETNGINPISPVNNSQPAPATDEPGWTTFGPGHNPDASPKRANNTGNNSQLIVRAMTTSTPDQEILALANGLKNDPKRIYDYVHNNIDYVPYYGYVKGPTMTYLDGSGNDFDQASLMIALLNAANINTNTNNISASYMHGTMTIPLNNLSNWLGNVDATTSAISNALSADGIPHTTDAVNVDRVWVQATINGSSYQFDPAFKSYDYTPTISNIAGILGYNQADFLSAATSGATIAPDGSYIQHMNESNINNKLSSYAGNLIGYIRNNYPNSELKNIIGGRSIHQSPPLKQYSDGAPLFATSTVLSTSCSDEGQPVTMWTSVPSNCAVKLNLYYTNNTNVLYGTNTADLDGKRLTLAVQSGNGICPNTGITTGYYAQFNLDGSTVSTGCTTSYPSLTIEVLHPDSIFNQSETYNIHGSADNGGNIYAIVYNFGGISDAMIRKRQKQLHLAQANPSNTNLSEPVLGETLNVMGLTWLKEVQMERTLLSDLDGIIPITLHAVGLVGQEMGGQQGYYVDVRNDAIGGASKHNDIAALWTHARAYVLISSAFEHGVLEELMGSNRPAASTVKLLEVSNNSINTNGQWEKLFLVNKNNYSNILKLTSNGGPLYNYSANDITNFTSFVNSSSSTNTLFLPENGNLVIQNSSGTTFFNGKGYIEEQASTNTMGIFMAISDGYHGGFSGDYITNDQVYYPPNENQVSTYIQSSQNNSPSPATAVNNPTFRQITSPEPVDMAGGGFLSDHTDLLLGRNTPMGLSFARSYASGQNYHDNGLGYGWTHNYDIYLTPISDASPGLGSRGPVDAAAFIAALYVDRDLMSNQYNTIQGRIAGALASKWAVDQLTGNAAAIHLGNKVMEFIKLPDGTYSPPPGVTSQLVANGDGTYNLNERFGTVAKFSTLDTTDNKVLLTSLTDIDNNTLTLGYSGSQLTSVTANNQTGSNQTLTFNYSGVNLTSVTDSAGRTANYSYSSAGDLTGYTDADGKTWQYQYGDPNNPHCITGLIDPLGITTAANAYDSQGRVVTQTVPRQAGVGFTRYSTYHFYFSGFKNIQEDPEGNDITYYFDQKGRNTETDDPLGNATLKQYDGQNHVVSVTDPDNNQTTYVYDGQDDLVQINNALNQATNNLYDSQFRLTDAIDALNDGSHFSYDPHNNLVLSKYGGTYDAGLSPNDNWLFQTSAAYYPNGQANTLTDGLGTVTTLAYDGYGNPYTSVTGSHPRLTFAYNAASLMTGLTDQVSANTSFTYDNRGLLTGRTDPLLRRSSLTYYDDGSVETSTDRNGNTIFYTYTASGKPETAEYPDGTSVAFKYNDLDNLVELDDPLGAAFYNYDADNHLKSATDAQGFYVSYTYEPDGNVKDIYYPGGLTVRYSYDALNRITGVTLGGLSGIDNLTATYVYDTGGRLTGLTNFNGTITTYGYDNANRLDFLSERKSDNIAIIAQYDSTMADGLDANGNRTHVIQTEPLSAPLPGGAGYTYNAVGDRLVTAGSNSFTYDNEGQLQSGYGTNYYFDYGHRLSCVGSAPGACTNQYFYDGAGRRLIALRNGVTTRYVYDAGGNLLAETDYNDNIIRYYVYGPSGLLAMVVPATDQIYCYHFNPVGSTVAITDGAQNIVSAYSYDPFGNIAASQENMNGTQPRLAGQPFKFVGQFGVMTEPSGFYYMRARYYDPQVGRFISEDPAGFGGGDVNLMAYVNSVGKPHQIETNLYRYASDNPINWIDPLGLWYVNINGTLGYGIGITGGVMINNNGIYPYVGAGLTTPPGSVAITWSPSNPSPGWNESLQGGFWVGGQIGHSKSGWSGEGGFVTPGVSLTGYNVWGPSSTHQIQPAICHQTNK